MNTKDLSAKATFELAYIIYHGLSDAIENNSMDKDTLKELLKFYESNVIMSYNSLEAKFNNIE